MNRVAHYAASIAVAVLPAVLVPALAPPSCASQDQPPRYHSVLLSANSTAFGINARNQIAGTLGEHPTDPGPVTRAFFWDAGELIEIGGDFWLGAALNDSGDVVGTNWDAYRGFMWSRGIITNLGESEAWGINNAGTIVGLVPGDFGVRAAAWNGSWHPLASIGDEDGTALGINDGGDIVGFDEDMTHLARPVLWTSGGAPTALAPPPGYDRGVARAVNDSGLVVGHGVGPLVPDAAAFWRDGSVHTLPGSDAIAHAVNNRDCIVGEADGGAAIWWPGPGGHTLHPLGALVEGGDPLGALLVAYGINDCGLVVGTAANGAFLLIPEDTTDTDLDGLPDQWETCGIDANRDGIVDYRPADADPLHKDIYVEMDAMAGAVVRPEAIQAVIDAFAAVPDGDLPTPNPDGQGGITLHLELDETGLAAAGWTRPPDWPAGYDLLKAAHFGTGEERGDPSAEHLLAAKRMTHRYMIWALTFISGADTISGAAEIGGNDFFIALDGAPWHGGTVEDQAGTLMHELGHTLGLTHGGAPADTLVNFKPNYYSVMNYAWQFDNVDATAPCTWSQHWRLDYSHDQGPALDEGALDEAAGFTGGPAGVHVPFMDGRGEFRCGRLSGGPTDFDGDGHIDGNPEPADLNHLILAEPGTPGQNLAGWDDWAHIDFNFRDDDEYADGAHASAFGVTEMTGRQYRALGGVDPLTGVSAETTPGHAGPHADEPMALFAPSPVHGPAAVEFATPRAGRVVLTVHDVTGRLVETLVDETRDGGRHAVRWAPGATVRAGVYFLRLSAGGAATVRKVTYLP